MTNGTWVVDPVTGEKKPMARGERGTLTPVVPKDDTERGAPAGKKKIE